MQIAPRRHRAADHYGGTRRVQSWGRHSKERTCRSTRRTSRC